ncbi:Obp56e family protein [Megaselia abdita]
MSSLTTFIVLALAVASFASEELLGNHDKKAMVECAKEMGVDLKQKDLEKVPEFKCLFKCMLEKDGILKDGVMSEEQIMKVIKEDSELDEAGKEKVSKVIPKCMEDAKNIADLCVKSFELTDCVYKGLV